MKYHVTEIDINKIIVPDVFLKSTPSQKKFESKKKLIENNNGYRILLDKNNILKDGYISYLILKELGYKYINAYKEVDGDAVTYIYGVHPNSVCNKEYVWRLTNSLKNKIGNIYPGMILMVNANNKIAPIIVTRFEDSVFPPCERRIKKVVGLPKAILN